jgi:hypothetical protein
MLHVVALVFGLGELVLSILPWRSRRPSATSVAAPLLMVLAMTDSGVFGPPLIPALVWAGMLVTGGIMIALLGRHRQSARSGSPGARPSESLELSLGLIAMAFIPFMSTSHLDGSAGDATAVHSHGVSGAALVPLLIILLVILAVSVARSWRSQRQAHHSAAARACMLCSLITMMAAVV